MTTSYSPAAAAEFPNDNPGLHRGARWVCLSTRGAARAIVRASTDALSVSEAAPRALPTAALSEVTASTVAPEQRFKGPLQIDLGRIILMHRVEDVPPPPDFIFRPFVPSKPRELPSEASAAPVRDLAPIQPAHCRVVDERDAHRRVARGWRVDIAPCLSVGPEAPRAPSPRPVVAVTAIAAEPSRRSRRRGRLAARNLSSAKLADSGELNRAIKDLEAAFTQAALQSSPDESAGLSSCRASGA